VSFSCSRLDLVAEAHRRVLRESFRRYVDARLATYRLATQDLEAYRGTLAGVNALQLEIWNQALSATQESSAASGAPMLLPPALNDMIDITTTRTLATEMHPPVAIFGMLVFLALASALLAGYGMSGSRSTSWLHVTAGEVRDTSPFKVRKDTEVRDTEVRGHRGTGHRGTEVRDTHISGSTEVRDTEVREVREVRDTRYARYGTPTFRRSGEWGAENGCPFLGPFSWSRCPFLGPFLFLVPFLGPRRRTALKRGGECFLVLESGCPFLSFSFSFLSFRVGVLFFPFL
jgi:hypothetical protein